MSTSDRYRTLAGESEGVYREKASKFIAHAFPIADEEAFKERAARIAKEHPSSRHVCYAWILGDDGSRYRANDDGEPAGTAGKPILRRLQALDLSYCGIAVVRYFGGTLLGKAGLVHAYGEAAGAALAVASVIERVVRDELLLTCDYPAFDAIKNDVLLLQGEVIEAVFAVQCELRLALPKSRTAPFAEKWRARGATVQADQPK
jgi:uncharacterized YigZ family protein